jgi:hypothetical protein
MNLCERRYRKKLPTSEAMPFLQFSKHKNPHSAEPHLGRLNDNTQIKSDSEQSSSKTTQWHNSQQSDARDYASKTRITTTTSSYLVTGGRRAGDSQRQSTELLSSISPSTATAAVQPKDGNGYKIPACPRAIDPLGKDMSA